MGVISSLKELLGRTVYVYGQPVQVNVQGLSPRELYATQANLHAVISFLSSSVAQLPLKVYARKSDTDRQRDRNSNTALLLYRPNADQTEYEFFEALVIEYLLFGEAIVWLLPDTDSESGFQLRIIPSEWVEKVEYETNYAPKSLQIRANGGKTITIDKKNFVIFKMYQPGSPATYLSPIDSLKQTLAEQIQADKFRTSIWKSSGRFNSYITRPANVQQWDKKARDAWTEAFRKGWSEGGQKQGSMPILEDGMEIHNYTFNAKEAQYAETKQLSREDVAAAYHINPSLVWHTETQTYASAKDNARALYADCLGPMLQMIQQRINSFLLPKIGANPNLYVEFDLEEKLKGSFEERAQIYQSACGVPYLTVNEVRADLNRAPIEGGDERVIPLNVLVGGQMSAQDSTPDAYSYDGIDNRAKPVENDEEKSQLFKENNGYLLIREEDDEKSDDQKEFEELLVKFFERQKNSVIPKMKAVTPEWWDKDRWDKELSADLLKLLLKQTTIKGKRLAKKIGSEYYEENTTEYLRKIAEARAELINTKTLEDLEHLDEVPEDSEEPKTPNEVFGKRKDFDAGLLALSFAALSWAFATQETIHQAEFQKKLTKKQVYKVWHTGSNPRPEHARMNGERVPFDEKFSNGAEWTFDDVLGPDGTCGCNCTISVEIEYD